MCACCRHGEEGGQPRKHCCETRWSCAQPFAHPKRRVEHGRRARPYGVRTGRSRSAKELPDAPGRDAVPSGYDCPACRDAARWTIKTACKKLVSLTSSACLRFAAPAGAGACAAEQSRTNGAMLSERPARVLLMLARCTRSASAPVRLPQPPIRRTRPRSSPTTCWHLMRKRSGSATTVRAECCGCSSKVVNHRFTVVPPCYELTTMSRTTLSYAMGRSGSAPSSDRGHPRISTL